jgi:predicted permease
VIAAAAGGAGLLCAIWFAPVLGVLMGWPGSDVDPDARVFAFLSIATILCGLGAGLVPARAGVRGDVTACLKGHRGATAGAIRPGRIRSMLIVAQTAASVVLVVLAALLVRALADVAWQDPGYDPERLLTVVASAPGVSRDEVDEARAGTYWMTALDRVRALPGVESAALAAYPPFGIAFGRPSDEPFINETDAAYFDVIGARLVRGRSYTDAEVRAGEPVAVISEGVARRFWGVDDPLGDGLARVNERLSRYRVIGVVADAMVFGLDHRGKPLIYLPHSTFRRTAMVVRTPAPAATAPVVTQALAAIAPDSRPRAMVVSERFDRDFQAPRRMAAVSTAVAALALATAAVGLYGVTSFVVGRRRHEIGVRMAIGARAGGVVRLLVRDGMRPVLIGMALGVAAALAAGSLLASLMYGVSVRDPIALIAAVVVLLVVTLVAVAVPATRAARTDPALVLRADGGG